MLRPSLEEVKALAKQYNTIPVFYEFSADNQTPLNIYRAFSQESRNSFILESVSNGVQWDRYSFVGFSPKEEIRITGNTAEIRSGEKSETFEVAHPIAFLKERMAAYHSPVLEGAPNFTGGLIGYFGYDTVRYMEKKLTNVPEDDIHMPDCHLFLYEELLAYDHLNSNGIVILNLGCQGIYQERRYFPDRAFSAVRDQQSAGQLFRLPKAPCDKSVSVSLLFPHPGLRCGWRIPGDAGKGDQRRDPQSTHCRNKAQRTNTGRGHCQRKGTCRRPQGTCRAHHAGRPGTQRCG